MAAIVAAAAGGDPMAWTSLTERYGGMVMAIARSCRLNDADVADVHQVTWLRMVENIDRLQQPERIGGWLATTAKRESLRLVRGRARVSFHHDALLQRPDTEQAAPDAGLISDEQAAAVRRAFSLLPAHCQHLLGVRVDDDPPPYMDGAARRPLAAPWTPSSRIHSHPVRGGSHPASTATATACSWLLVPSLLKTERT
jgi:RNA polymerase sigma factor (sigma-70 family)